MPGTGSARVRGRGDRPRPGCRRWRGNAARGGGPLPLRRSSRPTPAEPAGRGRPGPRRARAMPDEIEQVAVLSGGRVGPLPGNTGTVQADEERAPASAFEIAGDPVPALLAALGQVTPADGLGARAERGGDVGGGRCGTGRWGRHDGPPLDGRGTPDTGRPLPPAGAGGRSAARSADAMTERVRTRNGQQKDGPTREAPARVEGGNGMADQNGISSTAASADGIAGSAPATGAPLPLGLSRNCTRPPGTSRISVENRSESSSSFFQRRVCSLPAT